MLGTVLNPYTQMIHTCKYTYILRHVYTSVFIHTHLYNFLTFNDISFIITIICISQMSKLDIDG